MKRKLKSRVLAFGCTHLPYEEPNFLEFTKEVQDEYGCGTVVHLGDIVNNGQIGYHEKEPDLRSPTDEYKQALVKMKEWYKAYPNMYLTWGNHDLLPQRKGKTIGLPSHHIKSFREAWGLPKGWQDGFRFIIDNVVYEHGTGRSGKHAAINLAISSRMSSAMAHIHSNFSVTYNASHKDCIFGLAVGCGVDNNAYEASIAFSYGRNYINKPIVGCSVIENGEDPINIRMRL